MGLSSEIETSEVEGVGKFRSGERPESNQSSAMFSLGSRAGILTGLGEQRGAEENSLTPEFLLREHLRGSPVQELLRAGRRGGGRRRVDRCRQILLKTKTH